MEEQLILPNTFLLGAQKAATTSVYNWLAQHPNICAPVSLKDWEFFTEEKFYKEKGMPLLSSHYNGHYNNQPVKMQGSVHYIYFEKSLERISRHHPDAKCILIVRNPIERALSAYKYALKFNFENLSIEDAFSAEEERLKSNDLRVLSELTYKTHGLYFKQITTFLKYFSKDQLKVVLYQDVSDTPDVVTKKLFEFLDVDNTFKPEYKVLNTTGALKSKQLQKFVFGESKVREFLVKKVFNKIVSEDLKAKLRWKIIHLNTKHKTQNTSEEINEVWLQELRDYFRNDIASLEQYLNKDLSHWLKEKD